MKTILFSKRTISVSLLVFFMATCWVNAQTLTIKSHKVVIEGKTNVNHDFTTTATNVSGKMTVANNKPQSLTVEIPVKSIINGERLMDKKTHEAFNEPKNPSIIFVMTEVNSIQVTDNDIAVTVTGNLSMGGAMKPVTIKANGKEVNPGTYTLTGAMPIKMSDFNMKAPTAMLGTMKTKDEVVVNYQVTFEGPAVKFN